MRAGLIVIASIRPEQVTKVPLAKHNNMVKTIPPDLSHEPPRTSVLTRRPHCNPPITDPRRSQPAEKGLAVGAITVTNTVARRPLPPVCLGQLPGNPFRRRARRDAYPQKLATTASR